MIADWFKTHRHFDTTKQKRTHASLYEFPIKGGIIKRGLKRPTSKMSFKKSHHWSKVYLEFLSA
jgi:hypothetical protein